MVGGGLLPPPARLSVAPRPTIAPNVLRAVGVRTFPDAVNRYSAPTIDKQARRSHKKPYLGGLSFRGSANRMFTSVLRPAWTGQVFLFSRSPFWLASWCHAPRRGFRYFPICRIHSGIWLSRCVVGFFGWKGGLAVANRHHPLRPDGLLRVWVLYFG